MNYKWWRNTITKNIQFNKENKEKRKNNNGLKKEED